MELTQEWIFKTLARLGFKEVDAQVYIALSRNGSQKAADVAVNLGTYKRQVYRSLKNLLEKGAVTASGKRPVQFSAIPLENVLEAFKKSCDREANLIEKNKVETLAKWQDLIGNFSQ